MAILRLMIRLIVFLFVCERYRVFCMPEQRVQTLNFDQVRQGPHFVINYGIYSGISGITKYRTGHTDWYTALIQCRLDHTVPTESVNGMSLNAEPAAPAQSLNTTIYCAGHRSSGVLYVLSL